METRTINADNVPVCNEKLQNMSPSEISLRLTAMAEDKAQVRPDLIVR